MDSAAAGTLHGVPNAKTLLHQFYQRTKTAPPKFDVVAAPDDDAPLRFVCNLTLATATVEGGGVVEGQIFQGEGRSKKAAQVCARPRDLLPPRPARSGAHHVPGPACLS